MSRMTGLHFAVAHDDAASIAQAEQGSHDKVLASIRPRGRRITGVVWHHYDAQAARTVLASAVKAGVMGTDDEAELLAKLHEFAPAVLITAEADYERWQA